VNDVVNLKGIIVNRFQAVKGISGANLKGFQPIILSSQGGEGGYLEARANLCIVILNEVKDLNLLKYLIIL
jgi:hypothetical protein